MAVLCLLERLWQVAVLGFQRQARRRPEVPHYALNNSAADVLTQLEASIRDHWVRGSGCFRRHDDQSYRGRARSLWWDPTAS